MKILIFHCLPCVSFSRNYNFYKLRRKYDQGDDKFLFHSLLTYKRIAVVIPATLNMVISNLKNKQTETPLHEKCDLSSSSVIYPQDSCLLLVLSSGLEFTDGTRNVFLQTREVSEIWISFKSTTLGKQGRTGPVLANCSLS